MNLAPAKPLSWRAPLSLALVFVAAVALYWRGLGPGDAERYLLSALRWQEGPWLGDTHWALRHLFVLPIAASFATLGAGEAAAILPNLLYAALTVAVTWTFGRRWLGARDAFIASALIATSAFFVARPLELDVYGAEAFFTTLAMWLFLCADESQPRGKMLVAAGIIAGLAWTIREQSVCLLAVFGILALIDRRDRIRSLALVAVGFGGVIAAELAVYALAAGDPFYRYRIDLGHRAIGVDDVLSPHESSLTGRMARAAIALATTPATTPMLAFAAVSALFLRASRATLSPRAERALKAFAVAATVSAVLVPLIFNISSARYYPMLTYAAFLVIAVAAGALWTRRPLLAAAGCIAVIAVNAGAADFVRDNQYAEARFLATRAMSMSEPVYSDPLTVNRARYQLMLKGWRSDQAANAVRNARDLPAGGLYFRTAGAGAPDERWCVIETRMLRRSGWTHRLLRESGLAHLTGDGVKARVAPPEPAQLIRMLTSPAANDSVSGKPCLAAAP